MDRDGTLDLWVVDCAQAHQSELEGLLAQAEKIGATYFIRDYVNRLQHPQDLRRLVSDALSGRCAMRPCGREVRPGIWIDAGAEIDRGARIVAPAYVGRSSKIQEDTLITRFSSIEKDCYVDCGTVVEDSSILANTHVGIWLEVRHAVANGNRFLSLEHEVVLEISDPCVMRSNRPAQQETKNGLSWSRKAREQKVVADPNPKQSPAPEAWQLGADLIQG
jgi:NDP-sugar pyrophosphorylase family protein